MFDLIRSFHDPEDGAVHELVEPIAAPDPETLPSLRALALAEGHRLPAAAAVIFRVPFPIEIRRLDPSAELLRDFWFRIPSAAAIEAVADHEALVALMSDYWLPGAITAPHHGCRTLRSVSSLNHMMWLHAPARADDWLLYRTDSHWTGHGLGLSRGTIHDRAGRLVATAMQEALVRWA